MTDNLWQDITEQNCLGISSYHQGFHIWRNFSKDMHKLIGSILSMFQWWNMFCQKFCRIEPTGFPHQFPRLGFDTAGTKQTADKRTASIDRTVEWRFSIKERTMVFCIKREVPLCNILSFSRLILQEPGSHIQRFRHHEIRLKMGTAATAALGTKEV